MFSPRGFRDEPNLRLGFPKGDPWLHDVRSVRVNARRLRKPAFGVLVFGGVVRHRAEGSGYEQLRVIKESLGDRGQEIGLFRANMEEDDTTFA